MQGERGGVSASWGVKVSSLVPEGGCVLRLGGRGGKVASASSLVPGRVSQWSLPLLHMLGD